MATTPPSASEDRIRRNVACINCRNSKVRCKFGHNAGDPCQRCAKLGASCVVDKHHKRTTKRSKLEQLEEELKTIKQAVHHSTDHGALHLHSPAKTPYSASLSEQQPLPAIPQHMSEPPAIRSPSSSVASPHATRPAKARPSRPRTLRNTVVSGEDIDYYFDKFLECFYKYVPVLRLRDPDECYEANSILFWTVLYIACRRYRKSEDLFTLLVDCLSKDVWLLLSQPICSLEPVHAMLLICAYPLPTIHFATDPSSILAGIALNTCMLLGLHTGQGSHGEFCVGQRQNMSATEQEASCTWYMACILAQRTASNAGQPPPSIQYSDAPCRKALSSPEWAEFIGMFDLQKYLNRLHTAMAAQITSSGYVDESVVLGWEAEFDTLKPILAARDTDITRYMFLSSRLEIQSYYFIHAPSAPGPTFPQNSTRAFNTCHSLITTLQTLGSTTGLLLHAPHNVFRSAVDATNLILSTLTSNAQPPCLPAAPDTIAQQARDIIATFSVREGDLPYRAHAILDAYWSWRAMVPRLDTPALAWPNRLAAGVTFGCLQRFNRALTEAKKTSESLNKGAEALQNTRYDGSASNAEQQQVLPPTMNDLFQDIDWSMFMNDFGWGSDAVFMGLPT